MHPDEHWGTKSDIYETNFLNLTSEEKENFDINAFITELILESENFNELHPILNAVFSDKSILPVPELEVDGEETSTRDIRVKEVLEGAYVLPKTFRVTQTGDHEIKADWVGNYGYVYKEFHGDGTSSLRSFRQEGSLSGPEEKFEEFLTSTTFFRDAYPVIYVKNGLKQRDNYSIAVSGKEKEGNFYPDYLLEFNKKEEDGNSFLPAIFEVKDKNILDNMDKLVLEKAKSLIDLSASKNIPAGVVFPDGNNGFSVIIDVDVDAQPRTYKTEDLVTYITSKSKEWKTFK
jgi:hypothetical protein